MRDTFNSYIESTVTSHETSQFHEDKFKATTVQEESPSLVEAQNQLLQRFGATYRALTKEFITKLESVAIGLGAETNSIHKKDGGQCTYLEDVSPIVKTNYFNGVH